MSQNPSGGSGFGNFTASLANMMNKRSTGQDGQTAQKQVYYLNGKRYTVRQTVQPQAQYAPQQGQYQYQQQPMVGQPEQMGGTGMTHAGYPMQGHQPTGYSMQQPTAQSYLPQQGYQHQTSIHGHTSQAMMQPGYQHNPQPIAVASQGQQMGTMQPRYTGHPQQNTISMQQPQRMPIQSTFQPGSMPMGQTGEMMPSSQMGYDQSTLPLSPVSTGAAGEPQGNVAGGQPTVQSTIPMSTVYAASTLKTGDLFGQRYVVEGPVPSKPNHFYGVDKFSGKKVILVWCTPGEELNNFVQFHYGTTQRIKNICKLLDVEQEQGYLPCLVFERGDMTLAEWIVRHPTDDPLPMLVQIATGLQALHTSNYIHGCLDPTQIVVFSEKNKCKLMVTQPCITGNASPMQSSILYSAPEGIIARQFGQALMADASSDMFCFGVVAFRMMTGRLLYGQDASADVIVNHIQSWLPFDLSSVQGEGREVLENLIMYDSRLRWTAAKVLSSSPFCDTVSQSDGREVAMTESQKLAKAMNEMRLASVIISVGVEYFTSKSNPMDPFYQREARIVDTMKDDYLKNETVFVTRINENYRLRINLTNEKHQALPIKKINYVRVAAPDGCAVYLQTAMSMITTRAQEVRCSFEPARCNSFKLNNVGENYGSLMDKYVKLDVTVGVTMAGSSEQEMELNEHIFLLRIPNTGGTMMQDCKEYFSKHWENMPQWQRNAVKIASKMGLKPWMKITQAALGGL